MARKKEVKPVPQATADTETKSVRLDLSIEAHRRLRLEAAKLEQPMAAVVRNLVEEWLESRDAK